MSLEINEESIEILKEKLFLFKDKINMIEMFLQNAKEIADQIQEKILDIDELNMINKWYIKGVK